MLLQIGNICFKFSFFILGCFLIVWKSHHTHVTLQDSSWKSYSFVSRTLPYTKINMTRHNVIVFSFSVHSSISGKYRSIYFFPPVGHQRQGKSRQGCWLVALITHKQVNLHWHTLVYMKPPYLDQNCTFGSWHKAPNEDMYASTWGIIYLKCIYVFI